MYQFTKTRKVGEPVWIKRTC